MSDTPAPYHPLGLPPGSVRAILVLIVVGMFVVLAVVPQPADRPPIRIPLFLFALLPLVMLFFAAHGSSIQPVGGTGASPLYLPRPFIRILIVLGLAGSLGAAYYFDPQQLVERLTPDPADVSKVPGLMLAIGVGFFVGHLLRIFPWRHLPAYQNFLAWISLIALLLLLVDLVLVFIIKPSVQDAFEFDPFVFEAVLSGVIAMYFAARS